MSLVSEPPAVASKASVVALPASPAVPGAVRAAPRFALAPYPLRAALALERELGIGHVLAQVLVRRGLAEPAAARAFLAADAVHDPLAFSGMEAALGVIRAAVDAGTRITVHGDYDVDGVCATAIAVRALRSLGAEVDAFLPDRRHDGYGLSEATVRRLAARGTGVILTVDCAITAVEEVALARSLGLEVVVTDHHAPRADGALPACPVVHPRLGGYPCPDLCGAGVAFKLAEALGAPRATEELELVALATVADLVPLRGENRRLVRAGLRALALTARPGLRALMSVARVDPSALDATTLGFRLAPRINAAGRLAHADAGLELLLTDDPARAAAVATELDALNLERRAIEQRILWEAEAQLRALESERAAPRGLGAYVLAAEGWHPGVVGIVASRIAERFHRPAVLVALDPATGAGTGSARSIPGFDLLGALDVCAPHLERYGGHAAAAGLTVAPGAIERLRAAFEAHADQTLDDELLSVSEHIDAVVSGTEIGLGLAEELVRLEPCGIANPTPRLLIPGARFETVRAMGEEGRHARFAVVSGGTRAKAVAFGCDGQVGAEPGRPLDASFRLELSAYRGAVEARLVLRHARPCAPGPIRRLVGERDYLDAVLAALDVDPELAADPDPATSPADRRTVIDRRAHSPLAALADALAGTNGPVLAVCADVGRRLSGLGERAGGFTLAAHAELGAAPQAIARFPVLVALDPPALAAEAARLTAGAGMTVWAWGAPELRFAQQMHELEYGLRPSLVALFRHLRARERVSGQELERLLRGDGPHGRSASLAARLIRVLAELELVSLDRDLPALAITSRAQRGGQSPTALVGSPSYRVYARRYEDGQRFLSNANRSSVS